MSAVKDLFGWEGRYRYCQFPMVGSRLPNPGVTVLIPTWNAADLLRVCLDSLLLQDLHPTAVIVVDNASTDSTLEVAKEFSEVRVLQLDANHGYSGALARALQWVDTDYVAVLNNDARPGPAWLGALVRRLDEDPQLGCAFPLSIRADESIDTAGDVITMAGFAYKRLHRRLHPASPAAGIFVSPPGVAPVYRTRAIVEAGGWDAGLHSQWDDVDVGIRLWQAGWDSVLDTTVRVMHHQGVSSGRRARVREFLASRNEAVVLLKAMPASLLVRMLPHHALYLVVAVCWHLARGSAGAFLAGRTAALMSLKDAAAARRCAPTNRRLSRASLDAHWVRAWFGLSRWGGRRAPPSP